ncbi:MAG: PIN domain-containing protein [Mycobacteriales bacterium]
MKSLDTNLLLRLVLSDVPAQARAVEKLLQQPGQSYAVADMVFAEMVWVLQGAPYQFTREQIASNVTELASMSQIKCNRPLLEHVLSCYTAHPELSFVDVFLCLNAQSQGATPLLTYDKRLAAALPEFAERVT